ncbi:MAG: hypothetical protein IJB27_07660 [Clostridia bacterium]|nr:hypothetical protein [Clostridia bacterium]
MATREKIQDWRGKILGFVDKETNGKKTLRDFQGRILGTYEPSLDVTRDFYGRQVGKGDILMTLLR